MIKPIGTNPAQQNNTKYNIHKKLVADTGYAATGFGTICGITGLKCVNFSNKMKIHKYSAWLAAASTAMHIAVVKGMDKFLNKKS